MQIGIVGKGSIGKCLAHSLKRSTVHNPTFLVKPTTFKSLNNSGIIDSNDNQCKLTYYGCDQSIETSNISISPIAPNCCNTLFDVIIICTKSFQVISALQQLKINNILQNNPSLILFHNGIVSLSDMAKTAALDNINNTHLIFGTTVHAATSFVDDEPFTVRHTGTGPTWLGYRKSVNSNAIVTIDDSHRNELCNIFDTAFSPTSWFDDLEPHLLFKLAINCCVNPLTAIYQIRNDGIINNEKYLSEMRQICTELCAVFRAYFEDIQSRENIKNDTFDEKSLQIWQTLCNFHQLWDSVNKALEGVKRNYSSMNRDIHFHRASEIDQINGYIVELGKKYSVDVAFNEQIVQTVHEIENRCLTN